MKLCYSLGDEVMKRTDAVSDRYVAGESGDWGWGVLNHIHLVSEEVSLKAGSNTLRVYGTDPENVFERIILIRKGAKIPASYLGPDESRKV